MVRSLGAFRGMGEGDRGQGSPWERWRREHAISLRVLHVCVCIMSGCMCTLSDLSVYADVLNTSMHLSDMNIFD